MTARILDGTAVAAEIRRDVKEAVAKLDEYPQLAVILCSDDPASEIYVRRKQQACEEVGIKSYLIRPFEKGIEAFRDPNKHLEDTIWLMNHDVDAIIVQLPLPKPLDPHVVFDTISPLSDVDVFSPVNVGLLLQGRPRYVPCTPAGIQELLTRHGVEIEGKKVTIINRSDIVGKPLSALLMQKNRQANATVTICHDYTPHNLLCDVCRASDIIVVAVGKPKFLTADMVSEGAVVVDVGINRVEGSKKIVGDVDFEPVAEKASWISPVPGGVGPCTIAMLLKNTLIAHSL